MIITVTSLKGGTAKTTVSGLLALYYASLDRPVIGIDLDPQGGLTNLFLENGAEEGTTICDVLETERDGVGSTDVFLGSVKPSSWHPEKIFVVPSEKRLGDMANSGMPVDTLASALRDAMSSLPEGVVIIVDTGTSPVWVASGIEAADVVVVPTMMSRQTIQPTATTMGMIVKRKKFFCGFVPVALGDARWEQDVLNSWAKTLKDSETRFPILRDTGGILPGVPYSRTLIRGQWARSPFPTRFIETFDAINQVIGQHCARQQEMN